MPQRNEAFLYLILSKVVTLKRSIYIAMNIGISNNGAARAGLRKRQCGRSGEMLGPG